MAGRLRRDAPAPDAGSSRNPGIRGAGDILEAARDLARRLEEDARAAAARCLADAEHAARERSLELDAREFEIRRIHEETERQRSEVLELARREAAALESRTRAEAAQMLEWARARSAMIMQRAGHGAEQLLSAAGHGSAALEDAVEAIVDMAERDAQPLRAQGETPADTGSAAG